MFSQTVIDQLGYYVYYLGDPRNGRVFYVGKGVGNRLLQHLEGAEETDAQTEKLDLIRDIQSAGCPVSHYILRHGLTEQVAFEVEAAMIDFLGVDNLSNVQGGRCSSDYGLKKAEEIAAMYEADELSTAEPIMLINLNRLYRRDMTVVDGEIYNPVHIRESRAMRKVLQLSDGTMSVLVDPTSAYGLETSSTAPDVVLVSITGHARWGASVNGDQFVRSKMSGSGGRSETGFRPTSAGSYLIPPHDFTCPP